MIPIDPYCEICKKPRNGQDHRVCSKKKQKLFKGQRQKIAAYPPRSPAKKPEGGF